MPWLAAGADGWEVSGTRTRSEAAEIRSSLTTGSLVPVTAATVAVSCASASPSLKDCAADDFAFLDANIATLCRRSAGEII